MRRSVPLAWTLFSWWEKIVLVPAIIIKSIFIVSAIQIVRFSKRRFTLRRVIRRLWIIRNRWIPLQEIMIALSQNLVIHLLGHLIMPRHPHQVQPRPGSILPIETAQHLCPDTSITDCESFEILPNIRGSVLEEEPYKGWHVDTAV